MSNPNFRTVARRKLPPACLAVVALSIVTGAFAAGLPGEFLVTQRWRALNNQYSSLSNAANIAEENYIAVRAAVAPILQGEFTLTELGVNVPLSLYHTAAFTMLIEGAGSVFEDVPDLESGKLVPDMSNALSNANFVFSFGYAWHIWRSLIIGANLNFAYQTNFGEPLMGTGIDFGANYRLMRHPILGDHTVGIATQNLIAPTMGTSFVPDFNSTAAYSRNLRLSAYSKFWESRLENHLEFDLKDFFANDFNFQSAGAVENFAKSLEWELNWRVGYWAMRMFKAYLIFGFDENILGHWGIALGAQMPSFNKGRDMSFHYQYNVMTEESSDATSHSFYVKADFGRHREENLARRIGRMASLNPNELYNRGRKLYAEGRYWDAFFVFSQLVVQFPDFFRNDWVSLFRADCQEHLDMRDQSIANYELVKETYPSGEVVAYADLGLMRIYYRNREFPEATNQFVELNKPNVPDSLRHHGSYIMGQIFLQNGELRKAVHAFSLIPDAHPDYIAAQHATAVSHAILGSDMKDVISALENAMASTPKTPEQQETINRSYLFMGLIFYEENALSKAVVALRQVPNTSYYAEDALLGLGWTALKARQWTDCIAIGQQLARASNKPVLRAEGMLINAYGLLLQKDYPRAFELLKAGVELGNTLTAPSQDSLSMRSLQDENNREQYSQMSDRVEEYSQIGQTTHIAGVLDSLKARSEQYMKGFREHQMYTHEFGRNTFFMRAAEQVKDDLEYALATVQRIIGTQGGQQGGKGGDSQQLDAELEQLRRQMEEMEGTE
ncbi:MAG: tetratricopeptide repeat protein [Chitinispirillia bacterium]|nr:tetratricopeptide repeat protein [Chitinispirillia bacterium]MCL2241051.1 tetratricopeptide repeat protein [Chitinispirillia bacterium]